MSDPPEMILSREDMIKYQIPLHARDYCAHHLISLNQCRRDNNYLPWHCEHERHGYELCQHKEFLRRKAIKKEMKAAAKDS